MLKKRAPDLPKYKPCGRCMGGLVRVSRGDDSGLFKMVECDCVKQWRAACKSVLAAGKPAKAAQVVPVDGKAMAANG